VNALVDASDGMRLGRLAKDGWGKILAHAFQCAVLSVFPHRKDPEIPGVLMQVLWNKGIEPYGLANSSSAFSVVLKEELVERASEALFEPFRFSSHRTPADWKLAREGKEDLYREVVASYQEEKPKVYGLEVQETEEMLRIRFEGCRIGAIGCAIRWPSRYGLRLSYLAAGPWEEGSDGALALCIPSREGQCFFEPEQSPGGGIEVERMGPVAVFTMNGPHFGDRYGIASGLLTALELDGVELLGLSCTVASVSGVVPSSQLPSCIAAVKGRFQVPAVVIREA
jgi:hypothetical protein